MINWQSVIRFLSDEIKYYYNEDKLNIKINLLTVLTQTHVKNIFY